VLGEGATVRIIHVLRKPLSESTVAANTLKHGTGGLNIDASRIASDGSHMVHGKVRRGDTNLMADRSGIGDGPGMFAPGSTFTPTNHAGGRWPANVILQHLDGCRCAGTKRVSTGYWGKPTRGATPKGSRAAYSDGLDGTRESVGYGDSDGKETVVNWICEPGCPVARLDEQSGVLTSGKPAGCRNTGGNMLAGGGNQHPLSGFGDTGGASRFYKQVGGGKVSE
jgi:hypothetical protein